MEKILIVDDSPTIIKMLQRTLEHFYEIVTAENGEDGVEKFLAEKPDLIIMDLMMPVMDGLQAIKTIREKHHDNLTPILMLSAVTEKEQWIQALGLGANDFVQKPFHRTELLARISNNLKTSRLSKELEKKNKLLNQEKKLARNVQEKILPQNLDFENLEIGTFYQASSEIGGDFFDAWQKDGKTHFLIGDVSGHGTASALLMAAFKGHCYTLGQQGVSPTELFESANAFICEVSTGDMFLTLAYVVLDPVENQIDVVSAAHNPLFLVRGNTIKDIPPTGTAIGFFEESTWNIRSYPFNPEDLLFLYTDGLVEIRNQEDQEFKERSVRELLQKLNNLPVDEVIKKIYDEAHAFCLGNFPDDTSMFVVRRK
jgi:serine phosphatase RsbU (regulator of sigma subunit)